MGGKMSTDLVLMRDFRHPTQLTSGRDDTPMRTGDTGVPPHSRRRCAPSSQCLLPSLVQRVRRACGGKSSLPGDYDRLIERSGTPRARCISGAASKLVSAKNRLKFSLPPEPGVPRGMWPAEQEHCDETEHHRQRTPARRGENL